MTNDIEYWISTVHEAVPEAEFISLEPEDGQNALIAAVWLLEDCRYRIVGFGNKAFGKPEFVLEMEASSMEEASDWGLALLQFVDDHRQTSDIVSGALFSSTKPLVDFSLLDGWLIGLAKSLDGLGLTDPHLTLFPIHASEVTVCKEVGLSNFLKKVAGSVYQPNRKAINKP
jgi:hypothetical protein